MEVSSAPGDLEVRRVWGGEARPVGPAGPLVSGSGSGCICRVFLRAPEGEEAGDGDVLLEVEEEAGGGDGSLVLEDECCDDAE